MSSHFFIIGAQRCGTSFLYSALDAHPDIEMARPMRPEPKFFLQPGSEHRCDEYLARYFAPGDGPRLRGEKSASYIEFPEVAERIAAAFPDARIICALRDPVTRALSNYAYTRDNGLEPEPLARALSRELEGRPPPPVPTGISVSPFAYLARGRYADYLEPYRRVFTSERIRLVAAEALWAGREAFEDLIEWLGCTPDASPYDAKRRVNPSDKGGQDDPLGVDLRARLHEYFAASNARLEQDWGFDVSLWFDHTD